MNRSFKPKLTLILLVGLAGFTGAAQPDEADEKRKTRAKASMANLATVLDICAVTTSFYVSLETLNDHGVSPGNPHYDYLSHEGGTYVIRPTRGLFQPERRDLLVGFNKWDGPYASYQRPNTQTEPGLYDIGSPLDPWGTPYLFFMSPGLVRGDPGAVTQKFYGDLFDVYTVVSLGPDFVMSSDDLVRPFGGAVTETVLSSIQGSGVTTDTINFFANPGDVIAIRGYNFGPTQGDSQIFFGPALLDMIMA